MPRYKQSYGDVFSVKITGVEQARSNFKRLGQKIQRSIVQKGARAGSALIRKAAKRQAPYRTGALKAGIRTSVKTIRAIGTVRAKTTIRNTKGQKKKGQDAFYATMVIGGTKPHVIPFGVIDGQPYREIQHPGSSPNDFMWRAAREAAKPAIKAFDKKYGSEVETAAEALPK